MQPRSNQIAKAALDERDNAGTHSEGLNDPYEEG